MANNEFDAVKFMRIEFLLVHLNRPVDVPPIENDQDQRAAEIAANSLKLHGGNIYPVLPGGKLATFLESYLKEQQGI